MDLFSKACGDFGLTISTKKTEMLFQQAPATPYTEPTIIVNGGKLKVAEKFLLMIIHISYPGQALLSVGFMTKYGKEEVSSWRPSSKYIAQSSCPPYSTPVKPGQCTVGQTAQIFSHVLPQKHQAHQMAGQNSWHRGTPESRDGERLRHAQVFPAQMGRSCLSHVWWTSTKTSLLWRAEGGHIFPRGTKKVLQRLLEGVLEMLQHQPRLLGRSCTRELCLAHLAQIWVSGYETSRIPEQQQKRQHRKSRLGTASLTNSAPAFACPFCNQTFRARIGLISDLRTHSIQWFEGVVVILSNEGWTTTHGGEYIIMKYLFWKLTFPLSWIYLLHIMIKLFYVLLYQYSLLNVIVLYFLKNKLKFHMEFVQTTFYSK